MGIPTYPTQKGSFINTLLHVRVRVLNIKTLYMSDVSGGRQPQ